MAVRLPPGQCHCPGGREVSSWKAGRPERIYRLRRSLTDSNFELSFIYFDFCESIIRAHSKKANIQQLEAAFTGE